MNLRRVLCFLLAIIFSQPILSQIDVYVSFGADLKPLIRKTTLSSPVNKDADYLKLIGKTVVNLHRSIISPVDGDRCRMKPTCSLYSYQAYKRYGFFIGSILTFDRLMHEGDEYKVSPVVYGKKSLYGRYEGYFTLDPLENNVFWWGNKHISKGDEND